MLSEIDDTLWHQIPTTFDHVGTSDPRFFDRYWFAFTDPSGRASGQFTLGVYSNMDVVDAGVVVAHQGRQHNVRASRSLRPRFDAACGPLAVELRRPLWEFGLTIAPGPQAVHGQLMWTGTLPVEEEVPHFERVRGRVAQEYQRFNQVGTVSGELVIEGVEVPVERWWACRDHSWGVRPSMGIPEPVTGPVAPSERSGSLFAFLFFATDTVAGHVQIAERASGRTYLTGLLREVAAGPGAPDLVVADAELSLRLVEGTRRMRWAMLALTLDDGRSVELEADALGPSIAMTGLGYSGGWDDGRGLGVWRGADVVEHDTWDVSHPVDVVVDGGRIAQPVHRIQPVHVVSRGAGYDGSGTGSLTMIASGHLPRYGLGA